MRHMTIFDGPEANSRRQGLIIEDLPAAFLEQPLDFAKRERDHLAIENGIVMVTARKRLKGVDRDSMCRAMRRRRGLKD